MRKLIYTGMTAMLMGYCAIASAAEPYAYPVPYVHRDHAAQGLTFTTLPAAGTIKIFTISGEEVVKLDIPQGAGIRLWNPVVNSSGKPVQTGVYFFLVDGDGRQTTGKIVVIR